MFFNIFRYTTIRKLDQNENWNLLLCIPSTYILIWYLIQSTQFLFIPRRLLDPSSGLIVLYKIYPIVLRLLEVPNRCDHLPDVFCSASQDWHHPTPHLKVVHTELFLLYLELSRHLKNSHFIDQKIRYIRFEFLDCLTCDCFQEIESNLLPQVDDQSHGYNCKC